MCDTVATIVREVCEGSEGVATTSAEIAHGNHDLSACTESPASAQRGSFGGRVGLTVI